MTDSRRWLTFNKSTEPIVSDQTGRCAPVAVYQLTGLIVSLNSGKLC
jgi:hypothetical protein